MELLVGCTIIILYFLYKRYFPVFGVQYIHFNDLELDPIKIIDVRDYNELSGTPIEGTINIPIAYLKRNNNEIINSDLHLVASNLLEKNIGIRFLRKKGYKVLGYTIIKPNTLSCKENKLKIEMNR
ncbi:hypothetical protein [Neobacillus mesonae]|uniref:hypothetical protein n=1 Tax=Neobacillus mesonae TaxID=1193713 RepID=UPI0020400364|nr:hypothetical protein [Neobacillus mesonae]MCM3571393.1 hypothetical protein [Neobacillus mesonae]